MLHEPKKIQRKKYINIDVYTYIYTIVLYALTTGRVHKVLLLDWHRVSRSCLVHLQQGLARVLPGGCLFNMAARKQDSRDKTENSCFKFIRKKNPKVESSNRKAWASHAEQSMTQSWFNKHLEYSELDFQAFSKRWLFQEAKLHRVSLDSQFFFPINKETV